MFPEVENKDLEVVLFFKIVHGLEATKRMQISDVSEVHSVFNLSSFKH